MRCVATLALLGTALMPRLARADTAMPTLIHGACAYYQEGQPFEVVVRIVDASELFDPKIIFRERGERDWRNLALTEHAGGDYTAVIPTAKLRGSIEYFIETFDEHGNGPARLGSPEAPLRMRPTTESYTCQQVPPLAELPVAAVPAETTTPALSETVPEPATRGCAESDRPFYCAPWLWATVGTAVLVGGGAAMYFLVFNKDEAATRNPSVTLTVSGPDPTALVGPP